MIDIGKVLIPLPTPFGDDYQVCFNRVKKLAEQVNALEFTDSIIVAATSGEFTSMTFDEKLELFKVVKKEIGNTPLITGTGTTTTQETIDLTKAAEDAGVDVAMIVPPYYSRPSQEEIYIHFERIAEKTKLPMMVYNVGFTGVNMTADTIARCSQIDNIFCIKEIGTNPLQVAETLMKSAKGFKIYSGSAALAPAILAQGGVGVVCEPLIGGSVRSLIDAYLSGDIRKGLDIYFTLISYFKIYEGKSNPVPTLKYAMQLAGYEVGKPRPPLTELKDEARDKVKATLDKLGII
jgi:4-hydroxy-tetrahydrodipicolinate synthase